MDWYKVHFTSEQVERQEHWKLHNEFVETTIRQPITPDVCQFINHVQLDGTRTMYFPPPAIPFIAALLARYGAVPCEKPDPSEVRFDGGLSSAPSLLGME